MQGEKSAVKIGKILLLLLRKKQKKTNKLKNPEKSSVKSGFLDACFACKELPPRGDFVL